MADGDVETCLFCGGQFSSSEGWIAGWSNGDKDVCVALCRDCYMCFVAAALAFPGSVGDVGRPRRDFTSRRRISKLRRL